jgi:nitrile hydratase accessory protein
LSRSPKADRVPTLLRADDPNAPVFAEPWQAQAFALANSLCEAGMFTRSEWADYLGAEIAAVAARGDGDGDDGSHYYEHWVTALERIVADKGMADRGSLQARKAAWASAYRATPHGKPVALIDAGPATPPAL